MRLWNLVKVFVKDTHIPLIPFFQDIKCTLGRKVAASATLQRQVPTVEVGANFPMF